MSGLYNEVKGLDQLSKPVINAFEYVNPADSLNILDRSSPIDQHAKQMKDNDIQKIIDWIQNSKTVHLTYAPRKIKNYYKHIRRLKVENGVLYRQFYNDA